MRSIHNVIAGNSLAILLTVVCVLPITALLAFSATAPLDDATASLGLWLHDKYEWTFPRFDTEERFAKIGFAIRAVVIAVSIIGRNTSTRVRDSKLTHPLRLLV